MIEIKILQITYEIDITQIENLFSLIVFFLIRHFLFKEFIYFIHIINKIHEKINNISKSEIWDIF